MADILYDYGYLFNIIKQTAVIDSVLNAAKFVEEDEFRPWETFKMLEAFLDRNRLETLRNIAEYLGLPDKCEDHTRIRVTSVVFNDLWGKIVDKLQEGMVPFLSLVEVLCGGQLSQPCYGCSDELTVGGVCYHSWTHGMEIVDGPVVMFGNSTHMGLCGKLCAQQCRARILEIEKDMETTYVKIACKFGDDH